MKFLLIISLLFSQAFAQQPMFHALNKATAAPVDHAALFIAAVEGGGDPLSPTEESAITQLVADLKTYDLWNKTVAFYPLVGGTASAHKWNLKDPQNTDAAFRLTYTGTITHSANGMSFTAANTAYADTKLKPSDLPQNSFFFGAFSRSSGMGDNDIGSNNTAVSSYNRLIIRYIDGVLYTNLNSLGGTFDTNASGQGVFLSTRTASNALKVYKNGAVFKSNTTASTTPSTYNYYIGAANHNGSPTGYTTREFAGIFFGNVGLTDTDAINLYNILITFNTTLGR